MSEFVVRLHRRETVAGRLARGRGSLGRRPFPELLPALTSDEREMQVAAQLLHLLTMRAGREVVPPQSAPGPVAADHRCEASLSGMRNGGCSRNPVRNVLGAPTCRTTRSVYAKKTASLEGTWTEDGSMSFRRHTVGRRHSRQFSRSATGRRCARVTAASVRLRPPKQIRRAGGNCLGGGTRAVARHRLFLTAFRDPCAIIFHPGRSARTTAIAYRREDSAASAVSKSRRPVKGE